MTFIVRHSERIDYAHPEYWKTTLRYSQNRKDPYITVNGVDIAKKAAQRLLYSIRKDGLRLPDYIYSSPFTRCIETSIIISATLELYTNKRVLIRIENGLRESFVQSLKQVKLMDSLMDAANIYKRFSEHIDRFDRNYTPIYSFDEMKSSSINPLVELGRPIHVIDIIDKQKNGIICTHGLNLLGLYVFESPNKLLALTQKNKLCGSREESYCSILKIS